MHSSSDDVLLSFRAGTMTYHNALVTPDLRQGELSFTRDGDFLNMIWRSQGKSICTRLPKGKTKVSYVEQCKTGRVLLFEVSDGATSTLHFFWLQAKSTVDDADYLVILTNALVPVELAVKIKQFEKILSDIGNEKEQKSRASLKNILLSPQILKCIESNQDELYAKLASYLPEDDDWSLARYVKSNYVWRAANVLSMELRDPTTVKEVYRSFDVPMTKKTGVQAFLNSILKAFPKRQ